MPKTVKFLHKIRRITVWCIPEDTEVQNQKGKDIPMDRWRLEFREWVAETSDEALIAEVRRHKDFGTKILEVPDGYPATPDLANRYARGPLTSATAAPVPEGGKPPTPPPPPPSGTNGNGKPAPIELTKLKNIAHGDVLLRAETALKAKFGEDEAATAGFITDLGIDPAPLAEMTKANLAQIVNALAQIGGE